MLNNLLSRYNIILLNKTQKQRLKQNPDNKSGLSTHLKRHNDADTLQSKNQIINAYLIIE